MEQEARIEASPLESGLAFQQDGSEIEALRVSFVRVLDESLPHMVIQAMQQIVDALPAPLYSEILQLIEEVTIPDGAAIEVRHANFQRVLDASPPHIVKQVAHRIVDVMPTAQFAAMQQLIEKTSRTLMECSPQEDTGELHNKRVAKSDCDDSPVARAKAKTRKLRAELRRALSEESTLTRLREERPPAFASRSQGSRKSVDSADVSNDAEVARLDAEIEALSRRLRSEEELAGLRAEVTKAQQLLLSLQTQEQIRKLSAEDVSQAEALLSDAPFETPATQAEKELAEEKEVLQRQIHALRSARSPKESPEALYKASSLNPLSSISEEQPREAAQASASSARALQHQQKRRLEQLDAIASRLHSELRRRKGAGSGTATPAFTQSPASTAGALLRRSPGAGSSSCGDAWSLASASELARREARGRQLESQIKALTRRFLTIRDLKACK
eukprot:TRINITY_DN22356_c0_g1_i2.p1 TRINITY_DN22356_c0_g1~~TRINITY_DN22356_c0_g1_i2.p1  ORF type:complete len:447 (-),score=109.48 TRINITY_DN22356_c0_g1_i2:30-1370(-)